MIMIYNHVNQVNPEILSSIVSGRGKHGRRENINETSPGQDR